MLNSVRSRVGTAWRVVREAAVPGPQQAGPAERFDPAAPVSHKRVIVDKGWSGRLRNATRGAVDFAVHGAFLSTIGVGGALLMPVYRVAEMARRTMVENPDWLSSLSGKEKLNHLAQAGATVLVGVGVASAGCLLGGACLTALGVAAPVAGVVGEPSSVVALGSETRWRRSFCCPIPPPAAHRRARTKKFEPGFAAVRLGWSATSASISAGGWSARARFSKAIRWLGPSARRRRSLAKLRQRCQPPSL